MQVVLAVAAATGGTVTPGDPVGPHSVRAAARRGLVDIDWRGGWGRGSGSSATLTGAGRAAAIADHTLWQPVAGAALLLVDMAFGARVTGAARLVAARRAATRPGYRAALVDLADAALDYDDGDPRWADLRASERLLDAADRAPR